MALVDPGAVRRRKSTTYNGPPGVPDGTGKPTGGVANRSAAKALIYSKLTYIPHESTGVLSDFVPQQVRVLL
jgi:hypothetical protein